MKLNRNLHQIEVSYPVLRDLSCFPDNYTQVVSMAQSQERRLKRNSQLNAYNAKLKKSLDRGCAKELTKTEVEDWKGTINYVSHHGVEKPESTTTPLRIVTNSSLNSMDSGISYNSLLCKGPNSITSLVQVLVTWRVYGKVVVFDLSKAYNCMVTGLEENHLC